MLPRRRPWESAARAVARISLAIHRCRPSTGMRSSRDLRLAHTWCNDLLIHSLEGCVEQGYLTGLTTFDWDRLAPRPASVSIAIALRLLLRAVLWACAHPVHVVAILVVVGCLTEKSGAVATGAVPDRQ